MKNSIGIVIRALGIGGAEKQSILLANALNSEYEVFFFVQKQYPKEQVHLDFIKETAINYIQLEGSFIRRVILLSRYIKKYNIKILFSYLTLDNALTAVVSLLNRKIKVVAGIRNSQMSWPKMFANRLFQTFFFEKMLYNNFTGKNFFIKNGFSKQKSVVIPNLIHLRDKPVNRTSNGSVKILSAGRFIEQKDFYTALKAIEYLNNTFKIKTNYKLSIVGYGNMAQQIETWIHKLKLKNVELVVRPDDLKPYYMKSDIFLCTSLFEGMPNTVMEAINFSLPVVSTDVGDVSHLVKDEKNGFIVEVGDYITIAERLKKLILDEEKRIEFGKRGYHLLVENYSEKVFIGRYKMLIEEMLKDSR